MAHIRYISVVGTVPNTSYLRSSGICRSFLRRFPWKSMKTSAAWPHPFCVPAQISKALWRAYACTYVLHNSNRDFRLRWFQMLLGSPFGFWSIKRHSLSKTSHNLRRLRQRIVFDRLHLLTLPKAFLDFPQVTFTFSPTPTIPSLIVLLFTNDIFPFECPSVHCTFPDTLVLRWGYVLCSLGALHGRLLKIPGIPCGILQKVYSAIPHNNVSNLCPVSYIPPNKH